MRRPDALTLAAIAALIVAVALIAWSTHVLMTDVLPYDWSSTAAAAR